MVACLGQYVRKQYITVELFTVRKDTVVSYLLSSCMLLFTWVIWWKPGSQNYTSNHLSVRGYDSHVFFFLLPTIKQCRWSVWSSAVSCRWRRLSETLGHKEASYQSSVQRYKHYSFFISFWLQETTMLCLHASGMMTPSGTCILYMYLLVAMWRLTDAGSSVM